MITFNNYNQDTQNINWEKLPEILHKTHKELIPLAQEGAYNADEDVKRVVDSYISKLNVAISKQKSEKAPEPVPEPVTKTTKPKKETKASNATPVERIDDEISLIKRYVNFHNKQKSRDQITNLLKSVQKAILEKRVNKLSKHGKEVMQIQDSLIGALKHNVSTFDIKIEKSQLEHYTGIANGVAPMTSIQLIKRYVSLLGKKDIKGKVERLAKHFEHTMEKGLILKSDKYATQVSDCYNDLQNYLVGNTKMLTMNEQTLNGLGFIPSLIAATAGAAVQAVCHHHLTKTKNNLSGIDNCEHMYSRAMNQEYPRKCVKCGEKENSKSEPEVMSVADAKAETFKEIGFANDFLKLIGRACAPTSIFIYGNGGSGKSGLALKLADQLHQLKHSVLYAAGEQYGTPSFSELLKKVNITGGENFKLVKSLDTLPIKNFDVIVIDSKESAGIDHSSKFKALRDQYPDKIWILTSQGTKAGDYSGDGKWLNECEAFIYCENGKATTIGEKNRWSGKDEIKLF